MVKINYYINELVCERATKAVFGLETGPIGSYTVKGKNHQSEYWLRTFYSLILKTVCSRT